MWMEGKVEDLAKGEVWVGRGLCGMEGDLRDLRGVEWEGLQTCWQPDEGATWSCRCPHHSQLFGA